MAVKSTQALISHRLAPHSGNASNRIVPTAQVLFLAGSRAALQAETLRQARIDDESETMVMNAAAKAFGLGKPLVDNLQDCLDRLSAASTFLDAADRKVSLRVRELRLGGLMPKTAGQILSAAIDMKIHAELVFMQWKLGRGVNGPAASVFRPVLKVYKQARRFEHGLGKPSSSAHRTEEDIETAMERYAAAAKEPPKPVPLTQKAADISRASWELPKPQVKTDVSDDTVEAVRVPEPVARPSQRPMAHALA